MFTITVIICALGSEILSFEVPGPVTLDKQWINVPALQARFGRKQCWVESKEETDAVQ